MMTFENGDWMGTIDDVASRDAFLKRMDLDHHLPFFKVFPCDGKRIIGVINGKPVMSRDLFDEAARDGVCPIEIGSN